MEGYLSIKAGKTPDWAAVRKAVAAMTPLEVLFAIEQGHNWDVRKSNLERWLAGERSKGTGSRKDDDLEMISDYLDTKTPEAFLLAAVRNVERAWKSNMKANPSRAFVSFTSYTGTDGCFLALCTFDEAKLVKVAGFKIRFDLDADNPPPRGGTPPRGGARGLVASLKGEQSTATFKRGLTMTLRLIKGLKLADAPSN